MSVVDSGAPPRKWGVFVVQDGAEGWLRRVVAIKVIRRGGWGRGGVQPRGCFAQVLRYLDSSHLGFLGLP